MHTKGSSLVFLSDELLNPHTQHIMKLPMNFVSFAFIQGKMFKHWQRKGTFVVQSGKQRWGNDVVYGAIFLMRDAHFYVRTLDAYYLCSLSTLNQNHRMDLHHRITVQATPITFSDVEQFVSLRYQEKEPIHVQVYVGNPTHPNITQRVFSPSRHYRITDGVNKNHFKSLLREVLTE